ncbi:MAG: hypothetical protein FJ271_20915 [Planctomycetes bacterium]|nr:hypothetical protein [Planctomycetota bacterium]
MNTRAAAIGVLVNVLLVGACHGQAAAELDKLLDQSLRLEAKRARLILQRAFSLIEEEVINLNVAERDKLTAKLAQAVKRLTVTPADLRTLLGDKAAWTVARQASYRRYREQWLLESPVRLLAAFNCPEGQESRLESVRPLPSP